MPIVFPDLNHFVKERREIRVDMKFGIINEYGNQQQQNDVCGFGLSIECHIRCGLDMVRIINE